MIYTITARPKKYANVPSNATAKDQAKYDSIMLLGLESLGYGNLQPLLDKGYVQRLPQPNYRNKFQRTVLRIPRELDIPLWNESIMFNPNVPLKAKGLYAYFCLILNEHNGGVIQRERVTEDLEISYKLYLQLRNILLANGAISVSIGRQYDRITRTPSFVHCPTLITTQSAFVQGGF